MINTLQGCVCSSAGKKNVKKLKPPYENHSSEFCYRYKQPDKRVLPTTNEQIYYYYVNVLL